MILPGVQALLGFKLIVTLHRSFEELAASSRLIHIVSLCAVALAVVLLMTPAALHRITFAGGYPSILSNRIGLRYCGNPSAGPRNRG